MSGPADATVGNEIAGLAILALLASIPVAIYLAWPEGGGLHRYLVTCDEKGEHCEPTMHLRYTVFPEAQRVVEDIVNRPSAPEALKQCVVVDDKNWSCQDVFTTKAFHDGEWTGRDWLVSKDVPRYVWRLTVLRNWWGNLWK